jgi:hypothetical protein
LLEIMHWTFLTASGGTWEAERWTAKRVGDGSFFRSYSLLYKKRGFVREFLEKHVWSPNGSKWSFFRPGGEMMLGIDWSWHAWVTNDLPFHFVLCSTPSETQLFSSSQAAVLYSEQRAKKKGCCWWSKLRTWWSVLRGTGREPPRVREKWTLLVRCVMAINSKFRSTASQ